MNDIYRFDPATLEWTDLTHVVTGTVPSRRARMGFAAIGGKLFVHGGEDSTSNLRSQHPAQPLAFLFTRFFPHDLPLPANPSRLFHVWA
jgi:hypothetical protein